MENYEYGQPITEKYRNRLFDWMGGGYSGCIEEENAGLVDKEGHWHPIFSTGHDGIDDGGWFCKKIGQIKEEFGYDCRDPRVQYNEKVYKAVKEVFGDEWYEIEDVDLWNDPRVVEKTKADKELLEEYLRRKEQYVAERTHRLDSEFMRALERDREEDRPNEVGLLDDEHIKETCALFCSNYKGNVGFMAHVLDGMVKLKYNPWCTCSDCGEQFQLSDYECFSHMVDSESYHGDGGIGVIMTRIQCSDCIGITQCPKCGNNDLPNTNKPDHGESDFGMYDFLASVLHDWIGVCWGCASAFECDYLTKWDDERRMRVNTKLGDKFCDIQEELELKYKETNGHKLYEKMKRDVEGRKTINRIRDLLEVPARDEFEHSLGDEWFADRLCEKIPEQDDLPGMTEKQEEQK